MRTNGLNVTQSAWGNMRTIKHAVSTKRGETDEDNMMAVDTLLHRSETSVKKNKVVSKIRTANIR